jgi:hypothetical protein
VFAQIGPDQPSVGGIPAHRVGDSSALMAPPSQVERCPPNRVNSKILKRFPPIEVVEMPKRAYSNLIHGITEMKVQIPA